MFYRKEWVNMYKRILSFLLVTAILVCAMPFSALTVAAAESGSGEAEGLPLYTEDFELAAEGHVGNRVGGWTVTAQKDKATVEIAQVEGRGKVLKVTQLGGASVNTRLDFVLPGTTGYSEATVSFDLYATKGAWLNSMGLRGSSTSWPRSYVSMKDNVLKDGVSGTALVENWAEKWYHIEIVASLDADNNRIYDVSIDGVPVRAGQLDHNATKFMGVMLELSRGAAATVMLDNVSVTAGEAAVATLDFENLQAGAVDVLEGWKVATHSRAATVTVTQLEDEAHGKVLKMTQTGLETDNSDGDKSIRAFYYMEAAYKNADLSFDVQVVQERSIFTGALGNANEDLTTTWLRGGLQMRKREFRDVTGNNTITGTHVPDTWHKVRLAYRYDEQANAYHYHVYFDGEQIYTGLAATAKVAVTTFLFELARNYAGEVYVDNIVVSDPTREPTAPFEGVEYLGHDTVTKHQWIGTYGASQAILFAKNVTDQPDFTRELTASSGKKFHRWTGKDNQDYISNPDGAIRLASYQTGGGYWCFSAEKHGLDLETPADAGQYASLLNAYSMAGYEDLENGTVYLPRYGYQFSLPNTESYVFTVYGNNLFEEKGQVKFVFTDPNGVPLGEKLMDYSDFNGGAYVSFAVQGSFTLSIVKLNSNSSNTNRYFGMGGFFFDPMAENTTLGLTARESTAVPRAIDLSWEEKDSATGKILIFRKAQGGSYSQIGSVDAGVKQYTDTGLVAGTTYTYKLMVSNGLNQYSMFSKEATCAVSGYTATTLTLDKAAYTLAGADDTLTVTAMLLDANGTAYGDLQAELTAVWDFDGKTSQTVTALTDENGQIVFTLKPDYMGSAKLLVRFADNDLYGLAQSAAEAVLFVGQTQWEAAPVIWKLSDAIKPGDTIGVYGYGLSEDSQVKLKLRGQSEAKVLTAQVLQYDIENGSYVMALLPEAAMPGVYDLWVENSLGSSKIMPLNAARPLFISEYEAWAGLSIQVSGRALDATLFGGRQNTLVHLVKDGQRYPQIVTKLTPYSLAFTVADLALGTYTVEISNDGGTTWGTLASGQTLTLVEEGNDYLNTGLAWMADFNWDDQFNVLDYGAVAGDAGEDTAAFASAVAAAAANPGGGVVYIPDGSYRLSSLDIPAHVVLLGQSKENTVITYCGDGSKHNMFEGTAADKDVGYLGFSRFTLTLDESRTYPTGEPMRPDCFFWLGHDWANGYEYDHRIREASHFFMVDIKIDSTKVPPVGTVEAVPPGSSSRGMAVVRMGKERFLLQGCEFYGYNPVGTARFNQYETIKDNEWILEKGNFYVSGNYSFVENNHIKGRYTELPDDQIIGDTHGICFSAWCHLENNFVEKMGGKDTGPNGTTISNDGESYLPETLQFGDFGAVTNATATSVTVYPHDGVLDSIESSTSIYNGLYNRNRVCVMIIDGRGLGQMREVDHIDYDAMTIHLKEAWDVIPDHSSKFSLMLPLECFTLYNNAEANCAKGVYLYGYCIDAAIAHHTCENTLGISVCANQVGSGMKARIQTAYYIDIRDNTVTGVSKRGQVGQIGTTSERSVKTGDFYATSVLAVEIRNNTVTGVKGLTPTARPEAAPASGIALRSAVGKANADNEDGDTYAVIIENNTLRSLDTGISYTLSDYGVLLKNNTFRDCTQDYGQCVSVVVSHDGPGTSNLSTRYFQEDPTAKIKHLTVWNRKPAAAAVEDRAFATLAEAIAAAQVGQTVRLLTNAEADALVIPVGKTVDLCGYELTAEYVVAFSGARLVDSVGGGLLKCSRVRLEPDNPMMPVWVEADGGYRFFTMKDSQLYLSQSATGFVFIAKPVLGKAANAPYMALANNGLSVKARMSWKSAAGNDVEQFLVLKGEDVQSIYSDANQIIPLTVNGAGSYNGRLSTTMVIESDTGVIWAGEPLLYTGY